jgi:hypothetical protein
MKDREEGLETRSPLDYLLLTKAALGESKANSSGQSIRIGKLPAIMIPYRRMLCPTVFTFVLAG